MKTIFPFFYYLNTFFLGFKARISIKKFCDQPIDAAVNFSFTGLKADELDVFLLRHNDILDSSNIIIKINFYITLPQEIRFTFMIHCYRKILQNTLCFITVMRSKN